MKERTEVFIAFTKTSNIRQLERTMDAWDTEEYEPVGIQVQAAQFDKLRAVAAEGMAKGDYLIADLGSKPDGTGWTLHKKGEMKVEEVDREWPEQVQ